MAESLIYHYVPHERTSQKLDHLARPVRTSEQLPRGNPVARFNADVAVKITRGIGTMWCAYVFAALALVSLPSAIRAHSSVVLVSWISQTFLQLVLLSVIIVGQNVLATAADKRAEDTYTDADAILHEAVRLQEHLAAQDKILEVLMRRRPGARRRRAGQKAVATRYQSARAALDERELAPPPPGQPGGQQHLEQPAEDRDQETA
jgi:hypothetical protein